MRNRLQVESSSHRSLPLARVLWVVGGLCIIAGLLMQLRPSQEDIIAASAHASVQSQAGTDVATRAIQDLRVGDRVLAHNPEIAGSERNTPDPDPATWRRLQLRMQKPDSGTLDIQLLRPLDWIATESARAGDTIKLDLPELGVQGPADVLAIRDCPPIEPGNGRVVTGTFAQSASEVLRLRVEGVDEPLGVTPNHPIWSEDRHAFVRADVLQPGDLLRTYSGHTCRVLQSEMCAGEVRVYNLEVDTEHVYFVSRIGFLVHNSCPKKRDYDPVSNRWRDPVTGRYAKGPGSGKHYQGTDKPWTTGAKPNSKYTHVDPVTGKAKQTAVYDADGNVVGHVDYKKHGSEPSGHWHAFPTPGNPGSGHGATNPHLPYKDLPPGWSDLPAGVVPHRPIGT